MKTYRLVYLDGYREILTVSDSVNLLYGLHDPTQVKIYDGPVCKCVKLKVKRYQQLSELPGDTPSVAQHERRGTEVG